MQGFAVVALPSFLPSSEPDSSSAASLEQAEQDVQTGLQDEGDLALYTPDALLQRRRVFEQPRVQELSATVLLFLARESEANVARISSGGGIRPLVLLLTTESAVAQATGSLDPREILQGTE